MQKNTFAKIVIIFALSMSVLSVFGCMATKKTGEFVESLRNPTSFPEIYTPEIKYVDKIVDEKSLGKDEDVKIVPLGGDKSTNVYLFQIRKDAEIDTHYHKSHDEILYIKKGGGILELDGTRHIVNEGMIVIIPRSSLHKYVNTGNETNITVSMFSPPFDGKDIKVLKKSKSYKKKKKTIYDKEIKKSARALRKKRGEEKKWFGLWGKNEEKAEDEKEESGVVPEEQKILVLTEEGREKIREARRKVNAEEQAIINKIILDEKLAVLQKLKLDGLISDKEFEIKKAEIIEESGTND